MYQIIMNDIHAWVKTSSKMLWRNFINVKSLKTDTIDNHVFRLPRECISWLCIFIIMLSLALIRYGHIIICHNSMNVLIVKIHRIIAKCSKFFFIFCQISAVRLNFYCLWIDYISIIHSIIFGSYYLLHAFIDFAFRSSVVYLTTKVTTGI